MFGFFHSVRKRRRILFEEKTRPNLSRPPGLQKCCKRVVAEDLISRLPDEILVLILSMLTFKEAATTSILSRRWRYLWTFFNGSMNLDGYQTFYKLRAYNIDDLFVDWVNHVLEVHQGNEVGHLRICYTVGVDHSKECNNWVKFAIEKRVRSFELYFAFMSMNHMYTFPSVESFCSWSRSNTTKNVDAGGFRLPLNFAPFSTLHSLSLGGVNVTEEVLQYFLSNCPYLEKLCVEVSYVVENLAISDPSIKLKYLKLYRCSPLKRLEICLANLVCLSYVGPKRNLHLENLPLLSELTIGDGYCNSFIFESRLHVSYFSKLKKLTLYINEGSTQRWRVPSDFPKLCNLKELEMHLVIRQGLPLFSYTSFIKASPFLTKFVLKLVNYEPFRPELQLLLSDVPAVGEIDREATRCRHEHLKVVEFLGFNGYQDAFELALHFLDIAAASLEKIVVDPRYPEYCGIPRTDPSIDANAEIRDGAIESAKQLQTKLPPGAQLLII